MRRALVALALAGAALVAPATAAHAESWQQPYGGCKEAWQAPASAGAAECRQHGWTVKARIVVRPDHVAVHNTLKPCAAEDSRTLCFWDGSYRGNGHGESFWVGRDGHGHYVDRFAR